MAWGGMTEHATTCWHDNAIIRTGPRVCFQYTANQIRFGTLRQCYLVAWQCSTTNHYACTMIWTMMPTRSYVLSRSSSRRRRFQCRSDQPRERVIHTIVAPTPTPIPVPIDISTSLRICICILARSLHMQLQGSPLPLPVSLRHHVCYQGRAGQP